MKKNTWDILKEDALNTARKKGDYTELAELKKVERDAEKRMSKEKEKRPEPILSYIDRVKAGGDPFKYESWNGRSSPDEPNELPKDLQFSKILPLPKLKYNHSKPKVKLKPLKFEWLPTEFDEPVKPKKDVKPKIDRTGIAGLIKI